MKRRLGSFQPCHEPAGSLSADLANYGSEVIRGKTSMSAYEFRSKGDTEEDPAPKICGQRDPASQAERAITQAGRMPAGLAEELFRCQFS